MPTGQLFLEERRRHILELIKEKGRVSVSELSASMNVSAVTIRQDLKALEEEGLLARTHGGAVGVQNTLQAEDYETSFAIRRKEQALEKEAIGRAAAALVHTGSAIAVDASTTVCALFPFLSHLDSLTIITNNLAVPELALAYPQIEVFLSGGRFRRDSYSVIGNPASIPDINLNIGFVSAWGLSPQAGFTEVSEGEMVMKQALLARCRTKIALLDSTKWGKIAPYTYAHPTDFDLIITTDRAPGALLAQFPNAPIKLVKL
jgi:DeoR/GlpR family transcriptional regulator of sugar metabolism